MSRPFASGSRQAPDPYDQYLEQEGFYRKHTARDSTCLFRALSEQVFDTQQFHTYIREKCVSYMRENKEKYKEYVDIDIDEYLDEMLKVKTYGTLLELRAVAYYYKRNVILFEAYNTGNFIVEEPDFEDVFRVFFTPEKHFDSVYTNDFIQDVAFTQALAYEILYKNVFKLPDVTYATERMLHSTSLEFVDAKTEYDGYYPKRITLTDGREFELSQPKDTCCILENSQLCHFHNSDFLQFAASINKDTDLIETYEKECCCTIRTIDALLPDKYISCVRQLLHEGITPFPYKVAKALDPDIYRNVEFDAWTEMRKLQRFQNWYAGGRDFQVGVKCLVKLRASEQDLHTCHIQEIGSDKSSCLVFIEGLGERHTVPYDFLEPLPLEEAKSWPLPLRYQKRGDKYQTKYIQYRSNGIKKKIQEIQSYEIMSSTKTSEIQTDNGFYPMKEDIMSKLKQFTSLEHFHSGPIEYITMPLTTDHKITEMTKGNRPQSITRPSTAQSVDSLKQDVSKGDEVDTELVQHSENYSFTYGYDDSYFGYLHESGIHGGPSSHSVPPYFYNIYVSPSPPASMSYQSGSYMPTTLFSPSAPPPPPPPPSVMPARRPMLPVPLENVNITAKKSELQSGADLPSDMPTLRYFYNLGVDYYETLKPFTNDVFPGRKNIKRDAVENLAGNIQSSLKIEENSATTSQSPADANNNFPNQGQQMYNARRFHSRYFNNKKDRQSSKSGNQHRFSNDEYGKNLNNKFNSSNNHPYNMNKGSMSKASTSLASSEQGIQTSPVPSSTSPLDSNEYAMQTYNNISHPGMNSVSSYVPVGTAEGEHRATAYTPQQMLAVSYNLYAPPPPPPPHAHPPLPGLASPGYQTYVGAPPSQQSPLLPTPSYITHQHYYPPCNEPSSIVGTEIVEGSPYTVMSYAPIYYSPSNNNGVPPPTAPIPQAYWYPHPASIPAPTTVAVAAPVNQLSGHPSANFNINNSTNSNSSH